jgi:hypothetical protein
VRGSYFNGGKSIRASATLTEKGGKVMGLVESPGDHDPATEDGKLFKPRQFFPQASDAACHEYGRWPDRFLPTTIHDVL